MSKFFCPDCGYEGDEPICPHCSISCESLDVADDVTGDVETYSNEDLAKAGKDLEGEEKLGNDLDVEEKNSNDNEEE